MPKKPIISVTTKTGDKGQSSLANGKRLSKADLHFEVVGNLDELNSWLGLVVVKLGSSFAGTKTYLETIQDTLFYIGAEVAASPKARLKQSALIRLEKTTHQLQEALADDWHTRFILPGGTEIGAHLDIARTVCRRAERSLIVLSEQIAAQGDRTLNPILPKYLNRLSDYLYVLRCFVNDQQGYSEKEFVAKD